MTTDRIVEEAGIHLITDKFTWVLGDRRRILLAEAVVVIVPLLNDPGQPAAFVLYRHDFELRISLEDAVKDQLEEAIGDVHELKVDAAAVTFDAFSFLILVVAVAGQDVQAYGRIQVLSRGPEFVIVAGVKRKIRMGRLPDNRAFEAGLAAAFQLFDADIDIIDRNGWNPDQPVSIDATIIDQPIIIDPEARLLHASIVESEQIQH